MPIARIGPSQWVDWRSATSSTSIAAITVPPEAAIGRPVSRMAAGRAGRRGRARVQLFAIAVDQEQGVIRARAEDEDQQEHRPLGVDDDPAGLYQRMNNDPDRP